MKLSAVLDKLPPRTPIWAIGLVAVIVSSAVSFTIIYTVSRGEIGTYFATKQKAIETENNTLSSILDLVHNNSKQITDLTVALQQAQNQNYDLLKRVSEIEKELVSTGSSLKDCEAKLTKCTRR